MTLRLPRPDDQRDLVLYLPDEILVVDHMRQQSAIHRYEFEVGGPFDRRFAARDPAGAYRASRRLPLPPESDHGPGEYAALVERAQGGLRARRSVRGRLRPASLDPLPGPAEPRLPAAAPGQSGALWRADQPRRGRVSGFGARRKCMSGSKEGGSRPARSAARSRAAATRSKTPSGSANCSTPPRTRAN